MKTTIQNLFLLTLMLNLQFTLLNDTSAMALAQAPNIEWAKTYGGNGQERAYSVQQTVDGGYIIAGETSSSENGDVSGQNNGNEDVWVVKIDASGTIEWEQNYGGSGIDSATDIKQIDDGGYVFVGRTNSTDGDVSGNNGDHDFWVVKLSATGIIHWEKNYGGSGTDFATNIQQTTDGGYIVGGHSNSPNDGDVTGNQGGFDMWVVKLQSNGDLIWQQSLGGSNGSDICWDIQQTTDGGYIVAGYSNSSNGDVGGNNGGQDIWIVKLSATGTIQWEQNYGGSGDEQAQSIQQTTDGGYIVAGYTSSNNGDVIGNNGDIDMWVLKLQANGNIEWQKTLGGSNIDRAYSIEQTTDGGYIVAGDSNSTDGDVGSNNGGFDFWVVKLNNTGAIQWQKTMGGSDNDRVFSIRQTTDGGTVVAGFTNSNDGDVEGNNGGNDFWVVKLGSTLSVIDNTLPTVSIYPNPVKDVLYFKAENPIEHIELYTLTGQAISITPLNSNPNEINTASYDMSNLKAGIYFIKITVNGQAGTYKVVKR